MSKEALYVYANEYMATDKIKEKIAALKDELINDFYEICILCIGSDRATGDSLGPIVGLKLREILPQKSAKIYGDLKTPIHAGNILSAIEKIYAENHRPFIIAVDAALSISPAHVGRLNIGQGPLRPGASVGKELPTVGHIHITGVVNWMPALGGLSALQSTRLGNVFDMAKIIAEGIARALIYDFPQ